MKLPISKSSRSLLHSFLVTVFLTFNLPSSSILGRSPLLFEGQESFQHLSIFFRIPFLRSGLFSPACKDSSIWVTVFAANNPNTFCTKLRTFHFDPLFPPCRVLRNVICPICQACVWSLHTTTLVLHMSLCIFIFFTTSSASHEPICGCCWPLRCFFASPFLFTHTIFFWPGCKLFTHSSTRQWKLAAYCNAACNSSCSC